MTTFTASEVRNEASNHWRLSDGPQQTLAGKMLQAYADRLEADEQAVPSAWMVSDDGWNQCFTTLEQCQMYGKKLIPLYTHPAPADAERLAEALRDDEHEWPASLNIRDTKLHDDMGGPGQRIYTTAGRGYKTMKYIRHDLAHSAQAQPPAASATKRERKGHTEWRQGTEKDGGGTTNYVEPVWVWDEPEQTAASVPDWTDAQCVAFMAVGLRHTEYKKGKSPTVAEIRQGAKAALAAQENPNG